MEKWLTTWLGKRWTGLSVQERHRFRDGSWKQIKCKFNGKSDVAHPVPLGKASMTSRVLPNKRKTGGLKVDKTNVYFDKLALTFRTVIDVEGNSFADIS